MVGALLHVRQSDINAIVARKAEIHAKTKSGPSGNAFISEKGRLMQARQLAAKRGDTAEMEQIDAKLSQLMAEAKPVRHTKTEDRADILARVNERNRKANQEAIRKAEHLEAERRRRERKLASANGTATPPAERLRASRLVFVLLCAVQDNSLHDVLLTSVDSALVRSP